MRIRTVAGWSIYWGSLAGAVLLVAAAGFGIRVVTEPGPVVETVMLDAPPACREIGPALQAERATAAKLEAAADAVTPASNAYGDAVLAVDTDAIDEAANALDAAKRKAQDLALQLATDQVATDAAVVKCTPERDG